MSTEDNFLLSSENLRSSPELWPEKIPGSENYKKAAIKNIKDNPNGLTQDDIRKIYQLGSLPKSEIVAEIKRLYDEGYQLGVEEAKEVTRGKYLNIFTNTSIIKRK
ncbi:hypothetical protein PVAND_003562 [Polypedilum vanderplanki]|uniref:Uncharacterized protein n=1 Tax=Polypedilum vanderplanki TaxID=319348 RepID=A0A9J6BUX8_POLVA|nr:hypothetical protein PVAND_003562 [Polypedilum vanderplanki]